MKIEVLGTGCAKCTKLYEAVENAAKAAGAEYTLTKVQDIKDIVAMGVSTTPALVIDGKLVHAGSVPTAEKLKELLSK